MAESTGFTQDADGNWNTKTDKRSSFESQRGSSQFKKDYKKVEYKKGDYATKSWWGNKQYDRKSYAGNKDGSRFQKSARQQGQSAREANNAADIPDAYDTNTYATNAAREAGANAINRPSNAEVERRKKVFPDWTEQRVMSIEQSKGILGR